jgi:hypothetical protein
MFKVGHVGCDVLYKMVTSVLGKFVIADLRVENVNGGRIFFRYVWQSPTKLHKLVTERPLSCVV